MLQLAFIFLLDHHLVIAALVRIRIFDLGVAKQASRRVLGDSDRLRRTFVEHLSSALVVELVLADRL